MARLRGFAVQTGGRAAIVSGHRIRFAIFASCPGESVLSWQALTVGTYLVGHLEVVAAAHACVGYVAFRGRSVPLGQVAEAGWPSGGDADGHP
jgi:hypothetical protein